MIIRRAEKDDIPWLMNELREFAAMYGTKVSLYPGDDVARAMLETMLSPSCTDYILLVAEGDGRRQGSIAGIYNNNFLNPKIREVVTLWWWVSPQFRGSLASFSLLDRYLDIIRPDVDWISLAIGVHSPLKTDSLTRLGFELSDRSYVLEVNHG